MWYLYLWARHCGVLRWRRRELYNMARRQRWNGSPAKLCSEPCVRYHAESVWPRCAYSNIGAEVQQTNKQTNKSCRINKHLVCNKRDRHSVFVQPNQSSNHLDLSFWSYRRPKSHRQKNLCQWSFRNVKQIICDSRRIAADMWAAGESAMSNDQLMTCNGAHHSTFLLIRVSTRAEREPFSG